MDPEPSSFIALIITDNINIALGFVLLIVLLICSAMISGAEVALFSLSKSDLEDEALQSKKQIKIINKLLVRPKKLLATILVANNFINIAVVILFASLSDFIFEGMNFLFFGINLKFLVEVVVITFLILLFGEILPKIYASRNNLKFATFMAYPLGVLDVLFSPLSLPMRSITLGIHNKL
ncbi:MAG: DUF21 domain-containing protein [Olleya sp.]